MSSSFSDVLANVFSFSMRELSRHSCVSLSLKRQSQQLKYLTLKLPVSDTRLYDAKSGSLLLGTKRFCLSNPEQFKHDCKMTCRDTAFFVCVFIQVQSQLNYLQIIFQIKLYFESFFTTF